jgi:penicillin-binding protein 1C
MGEVSQVEALQRRGRGKYRFRGAYTKGALCIALIVAAGLGAFRLAWGSLGEPPLARAEAMSVTVLDRHGRLLRAFTTADDHWRLPLDVADTDPRYLQMLMAFEDRRFRQHSGVDLIAVGRAATQFVRNGRIVSGASTLTMQVVRLLHGEHERTGAGKVRQMLRAWQLEQRLSKDEILRLYLRLAPFGGNIEGARAASLAYFGKEPRRLSIGEAALLVALPQSPATRRPDRYPQAAKRARDRVLARALEARVITAEEAARARAEPVPTARREFPKLAPHLSEAEVAREPQRLVHRLTLDRDVQGPLEKLAREHAQLLGDRLSAAILAVDHQTGEVIAHVGSAGYFDTHRLGAIDMTDAIRSPGSTLKPVIYGLAFELGMAHPATLIEDKPTRFGTYVPKNFDEDFHGTVTIREALAQSLNIPAVKVLAAVGPVRLVNRLRRLDLTAALPNKSEATLAIALGGMGMRLSDLATIYATLARGGEAVALTHVRRPPQTGVRRTAARRLLTPAAAWYVGNILKDAPPPASAKNGGIAYKTGTSYGFRDAWAVGYDGRYTIAVWVGRPDATATAGLTGRGAAAPILFDAFARLSERPVPLVGAPSGVLRVAGGGLPPPLRRFREGAEDIAQGPYLEPGVQIAFPPDRAELESEDDEPQPVLLKAEGGVLPLTWLADGKPIGSDPARRELSWQPDGRGFVHISVIDARGRTDRVQIRLR